MEFREREFGISPEGGFQAQEERRKRKLLEQQRDTLWVGNGGNQLESLKTQTCFPPSVQNLPH